MIKLTKKEFFLLSIKNRWYAKRAFIMGALSLPFDRGRWNGKTFKWGEPEEHYEITDAAPDKPVFMFEEPVTLDVGDLKNITKKVDTTYLQAYKNAILFVEPFGDIIPYVETVGFKGKYIDGIVDSHLREKKINVSQLFKLTKSIGYFDGFCDITTPSYSEHMLRKVPGLYERRDELLKEYKDSLDKASTIAYIDNELKKILHEHAKSDPANGFYIKSKTLDKVRKMTHGMIGAVPSLDDPNKVSNISTSLMEGWKPKDVPAITNNLRFGSYSRGLETAVGGAQAKLTGRVLQNLKNAGKDCGAKIGLPVTLRRYNYMNYIGRYVVGESEPMTEQRLKGLLDKEVIFRSPISCAYKDEDYCERCLGRMVSDSHIKLGPQGSSACNVFLSISLAVFHGTELKTKLFDPSVAF